MENIVTIKEMTKIDFPRCKFTPFAPHDHADKKQIYSVLKSKISYPSKCNLGKILATIVFCIILKIEI